MEVVLTTSQNVHAGELASRDEAIYIGQGEASVKATVELLAIVHELLVYCCIHQVVLKSEH